ncbi:hypothetical protein HN51_032125 [Arachis hypogaea]
MRLLGSCTEGVCGFDEMVAGKERKYYMLSGKGGVGKTSCAASFAVRFANHRHPTMVVSTDPTHSLSDSFAQDLTDGRLVLVKGVKSPLYALKEEDPEKGLARGLTTEEAIHILVESYDSSEISHQVHKEIAQMNKKDSDAMEKKSHADFLTQCMVFTRRSFVNMYREVGYH